MEIIDRIKNILVTPKTEWVTIDEENAPHMKVFTGYVLPLAAIPAIASFIGYGIIGYSVLGIHVGGTVSLGIRQAIIQYITMVGGAYLTAYVINFLAENFGARNNLDKAFSLVAYAYTPAFVAGVFYIIPSLSWLASLAGIYSLYLLYIGLKPLMQSPEEKTTTYFVVSLLVMVAVFMVLGFVLGLMFVSAAFM